MEITIQAFDGCPNRVLLEQRLAEALDGRVDVMITRQDVETHEDAVRLGFHGSPTVLIGGVDPFADESTPVAFACRIYRTPAGPAGSPTVEQLRAAIDTAAVGRVKGEAPTGPLAGLPIACTLTPDAGKVQVERWRSFDADHLLATERTEAALVVRYAKADDSMRRLRELVEVESSCCSFVDWAIDEGDADLRLVVTGTAEQLVALEVGRRV